MTYKTIIFIIILNLTYSTSFSQENRIESKNIVGTWKFIIQKDYSGIKIDSLYNSFVGWYKVGNSDLIFNSDHSFEYDLFKNHDHHGTWEVDYKNRIISRKEYLTTPLNNADKIYLEIGKAKIDSIGYYVQWENLNIYKLTNDSLIIHSDDKYLKKFIRKK